MAEDTPSSIDSAPNGGGQSKAGQYSTGYTYEERNPSSPPSAPSDFLRHLPPSTTLALVDTDSHARGTSTSTSAAPGPRKLQLDSHGRTLNPRSCVTCRKRKVKCDKTHPCNNCNRAHIECVFPSPGRAPRKMRKIGESRDKELLERLRRLEGVVKGMGAEVPGGSGDGNLDTNSQTGAETRVGQGSGEDTSRQQKELTIQGDGSISSVSLDPKQTWSTNNWHSLDIQEKSQFVEEQRAGRFENRFGRLVVNEGKSRYINNSFWANLSNEVEDLKGILNQSSDEEDMTSSPNSNPHVAGNHQGWVFGFSSQNVDMLSLHPLPGQIRLYWDAYKDRVDPLVKVLHIPTIEPTVLSAASHLSNLSKGFEALLFAIYYCAITSLSSDDCIANFGEEKTVLLSRYRFAIEQALTRAGFLMTEEVVVLQAFVMFLMCLRRNNDARVIWTLTGLVVRIAQTIGIHRDGSHFGLMPFEVEMRRRLWWQVCILDTRASEDHGCDPTIIEQAFDTKMPLNINDVDIRPDMNEFPPERQGCTDMSFCLIRFEVAGTFRRINYVPPGPPKACNELYACVTLQDKEKWITECHQRLEERYLKHCDMSVPIFWVTATVARLMMSKMWLMVYHPFQRQDGGASLSRETRDKLFITSLENIEYSTLLETESRTMKWGWLFRTYMQWHALAFMLSELCNRTTGDLVDRAWTAVDKTRDGRWGMHITEDSRAGHLWRPLKKLYRKAKEERQKGLRGAALVKQRASPHDLPQRTYSPNANPMFEHPTRPGLTRAPLSQAQVQRFTDGPTFGQMPLDKHELMRSPNLSTTTGLHEADPMDSTGLPVGNLREIAANLPTSQSSDIGIDETPKTLNDNTQIFAPSPRLLMHEGPYFGQNLINSSIDLDLANFPSDTSNQPLNFSSSTSHINPTNTANNVDRAETRNHSISSATKSGFDLTDLDMNVMDTSGDLNWESWDQLVRQFGMDVDQTQGGGIAADWDGGNWDVTVKGSNLKKGMGMGGGDWF